MKTKTIARVYAKSFLEIADEKKVPLVEELTKLTEIINKSNDLENILFLDVFTTEEKKSVFNSISSKISLSPLTNQAVHFLMDEKRIGLLPLIIKECIVIDDDRKGFIRGTIEGVSADLDPALKDQIFNYIRKKLNKEPLLNYKQNQSISAGYKVTVEDLQLDASLDTQLEQFKQSVLSE